jgi:hypothetical protein
VKYRKNIKLNRYDSESICNAQYILFLIAYTQTTNFSSINLENQLNENVDLLQFIQYKMLLYIKNDIASSVFMIIMSRVLKHYIAFLIDNIIVVLCYIGATML